AAELTVCCSGCIYISTVASNTVILSSNLKIIFVDELDQLEALAGSPDWFGDGSRIIITTRDEHLLRKHKVDHVSPVRLLSHDEAIRLFNSHAYNEEKHIKDYEKLSLQVVSYADGLPLALKVFGSFLYDKDAEEWMSTMDRLKDIPEIENQDPLHLFHFSTTDWDSQTPPYTDAHFDAAPLAKGSKRLVKLPELPSSMAIIIADGCDKLTTMLRIYVYDVFLSDFEEKIHVKLCGSISTALETAYPTYKDDITLRRVDVNKSWRKLFAKQEVEDTTKVESWKKALVDANENDPGHESMVIKKIVDTIFGGLFPLNSDIDEGLVGMRVRLQNLISQLQIGSGGVRMVGIWGLGGGGKTTLATSVKKKIKRHFKSHCIIENIREESRKSGLKKLQRNILSALCKTKMEIDSVAEGKREIKSKLCHSNVLVILDDVDDLDQLDALAGSPNWFGDGSRIIITTRDEHLLRKHKVDHVSRVRLLSHDEAIWLFNSHAYNEEKHIKDYEKLSLQVVSYADGLPLALKVLGSFLYDKDAKEWMSTMDRLRDIPESKIVDKLKISYDGLKPVEKELFLDVACFFRGKMKWNTMEIFDACGFHPEIGIKVLIQKSLITIDSVGRFGMHDLIQEMGHYIVRGKHPNNPEKHSRVWKHAEVSNLCFGDAKVENDQIEVIDFNNRIDLPHTEKIMLISKMKKLRWLCLYSEGNGEAPNCLSNELRYIHWSYYPASPFPDSFQATNLVVLKLDKSKQKLLWKGYKLL
ncbi:Toll/interleukin-1 receptor domain-containing protein, partial [Tanacetum coccineum]